MGDLNPPPEIPAAPRPVQLCNAIPEPTRPYFFLAPSPRHLCPVSISSMGIGRRCLLRRNTADCTCVAPKLPLNAPGASSKK